MCGITLEIYLVLGLTLGLVHSRQACYQLGCFPTAGAGALISLYRAGGPGLLRSVQSSPEAVLQAEGFLPQQQPSLSALLAQLISFLGTYRCDIYFWSHKIIQHQYVNLHTKIKVCGAVEEVRPWNTGLWAGHSQDWAHQLPVMDLGGAHEASAFLGGSI